MNKKSLLKKLLTLLTVLIMLCFTFTACEFPGAKDDEVGRHTRNHHDEDEDDEDDEDEDDEDDDDDEDSNEHSQELAVYEGTLETEYNEGAPVQYTIVLLDDTNCTYERKELGTDNNYSIYHYEGTYTIESENEIDIVYSYYESDVFVSAEVYGKEITDIFEMYGSTEDFSAIEGHYYCDDDELGRMELDIQKNGNATLDIEGEIYTGSVIIYNEQWDLMVDNSDWTDSKDWYLTFNGDKFEYTDYYIAIYSDFAGTYELSGGLGDFTLTVSENGDASATITINGKKYDVQGSINGYEGGIDGVSLACDEYTVYLYLEESADGYNYTGSMCSEF